MSEKTFHIYRSSAGSGKTRTLAKEYLKLALKHRSYYFRHILAVTFTNKSTQEMKDRILTYLDEFASGEGGSLASELKEELGIDDNSFVERSQEIQREILHNYSQFSISTIDAFFQRVIRAFTRESGLVGDYRLEVDQEAVMEEVIDNLIDELGKDSELTQWVVDFAKENLLNDRAWDVRYSLIEFSKEIFKEEFKLIEENLVRTTGEREFFSNLMKSLRKEKYAFVSYIKSRAIDAMNEFHRHGLSAVDFKYQYGGVYNYFSKLSSIVNVSDYKEKGKQPQKEYQSSKNWPAKDTPHAAIIIKLAEEKLIQVLNEILDYRDTHFTRSLSAESVLNNFYAFGLVADISRKLKEYKDENNLMLLADAPKFLNGVISESDTPFIYEKVGSFYKNFLIDEFQDTSGLQWSNFLPLLTNGLDQGYESFVVGDVKQAIYRWRGGDHRLLQDQIESQIGPGRVEEKILSSNFRSAANLVQFNNALFAEAAEIAAGETDESIASAAFKDIEQKNSRQESGYVHIKFLKEDNDAPWKEKATELIPAYLEKLQESGVLLRDIAILVRTNFEGQQIVSHLLQYKNGELAKPRCRYDVLSNESLRIDGAASVNLLLGAMRYLHNPDDDIARAQLAFEYAKLHDADRSLTEVLSVTNAAVFESLLPDTFTRSKISLKKLPLFELTETLIDVFDLKDQQGELTYMNAFQDLILNFYTRERNDLSAFLEWWEANRHTEKTSIKTSGEIDAAQIITIHKAKGLQFKYVLIPFCAWELDHYGMKSPNLWVKSEEPLFQQAGHLPVRYNKMLTETYFSEYYEREQASAMLDNLNLLYVAFTRAELGLIVTAPDPDVRFAKASVARLVHDSIKSNIQLLANWSEATHEWNDGNIVPSLEIVEVETKTLPLTSYPTYRWRDKLVIRQAGKSFFEQFDPEVRERINYGIHIHNVLSRIKHHSDMLPALDHLVASGYVTKEELPTIEDQLKSLLNHPDVATWFDSSWNVRTEVPILLPGGGESRIDRLMTRDSRAIVVDFKTGRAVKDDQAQVASYIEILRKMNYTNVEGYILYLRDSEVVEVTSGKHKKVRKRKDEDQLDLFG